MIDANKYIGMGKRRAQNLAELDNLTFRLVSSNGELMLGKPEDVRTDRLCVVIDNDQVKEAWIG